MPNWCANTIEIRGKFADLEVVRDLVKGDSDFDFTKIVPEPVEYTIDEGFTKPGNINDVFPDWYNWRVANWGTKWNNSGDDVIVTFEHIGREGSGVGCLQFNFDTAWGPCEPIVAALAAKFPDLKFGHSWDEPGMNFGGYKVYVNGAEERADEGDSRSTTWAVQAENELDEASY